VTKSREVNALLQGRGGECSTIIIYVFFHNRQKILVNNIINTCRIHTLRLCTAHTAPGVERGRDKGEKIPIAQGNINKKCLPIGAAQSFLILDILLIESE